MSRICAVVSRHPLSDAQRADFAGFDIVEIPDRMAYHEVWQNVLYYCGEAPDLMVLIFRRLDYAQLVKDISRFSPKTRVLYPINIPPEYSPTKDFLWTGVWREVVWFGPGVRLVDWKPEIMALAEVHS